MTDVHICLFADLIGQQTVVQNKNQPQILKTEKVKQNKGKDSPNASNQLSNGRIFREKEVEYILLASQVTRC